MGLASFDILRGSGHGILQDLMKQAPPIAFTKSQLREQYGDVFDRLSEVLFRHDPIEIDLGNNRDEYDPEAQTILPRLRRCSSVADVQNVIHEEFCVWFGAESAGEKSRYTDVATDVWELWSASPFASQRAG